MINRQYRHKMLGVLFITVIACLATFGLLLLSDQQQLVSPTNISPEIRWSANNHQQSSAKSVPQSSARSVTRADNAAAYNAAAYNAAAYNAAIVENRIVFVIGDLHGDFGCLIRAVELTNLVRGELTYPSMSHLWTWTEPTAKLVFVGDYIDRGPQSHDVLQLVIALEMRFPDQVIALLGNHELEALLDRNTPTWRHKALLYSSSYVNPYELLRWVPHETVTDDTLGAVDAIYRTLLDCVYGEPSVRMTVTISPDGPNSIVDLVEPQSFRPTVRRELERLQQAYVDGFSGKIGKWLQSRPITYMTDDGELLFVHGGIDPAHFGSGRTLSGGWPDLVALNEQFQQNSSKELLAKFIQTTTGKVMYDLLTYRGNHGNCRSIDAIKASTGASHVIVGHTPDTTVRIRCGKSFVAVDSMISRWIRSAGNNYCKGTERAVSRNGRFKCGVVGKCMGEIVKMTKTKNGWDSNTVKLG